MKLDDVITDIDRSISLQEREINNLKNRKLKFQKIKEQYPDAQYENGALCLDGIWDKITCMRIQLNRRYYSTSKISTKFLLGKKNQIDELKIYTFPYDNLVAEIKHVHGVNRRKEITIFDYKVAIPSECLKRNAFIKRIKLYLVDRIMQDSLFITDNSFEKEELQKLILLK
jgi:hypothetical protein